jgi:predicted pyridoxine 5'-phosphate oxidase superfamily flavin-nucleotide-binding protein
MTHLPDDDDIASPFHAGELLIQEKAGVTRKAAALGRNGIRPFMPDQHRLFFMQLPFLVVGSLDAAGAPWASILSGRPGFIDSPDPETLEIVARLHGDDPLGSNLQPGAKIGVLGIEPWTRRRNRMNGEVTQRTGSGFVLHVDQSFGNCPQYIQARAPIALLPATMGSSGETPALSPAARDLIVRSDTLFIASAAPGDHADPRYGVDVSHRGGKPGFVHTGEEDGRAVLTIPDFRGNNLFNTTGNIVSYPQAGLLFPDFATGDVLQLTGAATVLLDDPLIQTYEGAQRLIEIRVTRGQFLRGALPLRWGDAEQAPQLDKTGAWHSALDSHQKTATC